MKTRLITRLNCKVEIVFNFLLGKEVIVMINSYENKAMLNDAIEIAKKAGEYLKEMFHSQFNIEYKGDSDLVTDADYGSERIIINEIKRLYPNCSILSEEAGELNKESRYKWVVDPLDGTVNFSKGIPIFGVILAVLEDEVPIVGVHYIPMFNEIYYAVKGGGSFLNGKQITVSSRSKLSDFIIGLGDFNIGRDEKMKQRDNELLNQITVQLSPLTMRTKIFGAACYDLACIASGKTDALLYAFSNPWDVLAGSLIIKEAGGEILIIDDLTIYSSGKCLDELKKVF